MIFNNFKGLLGEHSATGEFDDTKLPQTERVMGPHHFNVKSNLYIETIYYQTIIDLQKDISTLAT